MNMMNLKYLLITWISFDSEMSGKGHPPEERRLRAIVINNFTNTVDDNVCCHFGILYVIIRQVGLVMMRNVWNKRSVDSSSFVLMADTYKSILYLYLVINHADCLLPL